MPGSGTIDPAGLTQAAPRMSLPVKRRSTSAAAALKLLRFRILAVSPHSFRPVVAARPFHAPLPAGVRSLARV